MISGGEKFLVPSAEEHRALAEEAEEERILKAQVSEGMTLEQMEGACPGAGGEGEGLSPDSIAGKQESGPLAWRLFQLD